MSAPPGLRELTRRTVRSRIAETAEEMFATEGYEATTVEAIAERVGMSKRSFFRYFASKEEVVIEHYARMGGAFLDRLAARPLDEPEWDSLRRVFDVVAEHFADAERRERGAAMQQIVESSPALLAAYLKHMESMHHRLAEVLHERRVRRGVPVDEDRTLLRAVVGAAFCCLHATVSHVAHSPGPVDLDARLDTVMAAVRPAHCSL
ncbi:TetR/AcrR family transcriptional regulator [Streptomyces otsuchiensis]|uniref:TetR/AcrR family transcriptional regulator n=1 Tax=Streptomyces otsuchiensis TaxID=2681388 RepID=UPI001031D582|nr:TetR/AcrR family transcriptional regulator [Streptomyces otsuchiensis]